MSAPTAGAGAGPRVVVVGGGISGLTAAWQLMRQRPDAHITVLESDARPGGTATTDVRDGFTIDRGPNGFLTNVPDAYALSVELGLGGELHPAAEAAGRRYLYSRGRLEPAPTGLASMILSRLLTPGAKARMALEPFVPRGDPRHDESVHAFASRRLGRAFADAFVAPMVAGVSAGDATQVSLASQFPRMARLEAQHGSLVRGMLAQRGARRRAARAEPASAALAETTAGGPAGPGGRLTSFASGGAGRLATALAEALGPRLRTCAAVTRIAREGTVWEVGTQEGERWRADHVILATPAFVAADLLEGWLPVAARGLRDIPYAGIRVVAMGYPRSAVRRPLDGFGFLTLPGERVRALGVLWSSTLFPYQAPGGKVLLRALAGGVRDPGFLALSEEEAVASVREDLQHSLGILAAPTTSHVVTWVRGIPQYTLGHRQRVEGAMARVAAVGGVSLTGNAYHGVGLNDCVRDAREVASRVAAGLPARRAGG